MITRTATVFVKERQLHCLEEGPVVGVRFDNEILPKGVWIVGFLVKRGDDESTEELISRTPSVLWLTPKGEDSYSTTFRYARQVLAGERERDDVDRELIA
jgi:hypothetical protein